jgi:riboflavin kinase / FMN adenylyltransferase
MKAFKSLGEVPANFGPTLVSIGNFDGVHLAHARVIEQLVTRARDLGYKSVVVTFEPHPSRFLKPDSTLRLLTPTKEKLRLISNCGADAVLLLPFTQELSLMSPRNFAEEILHKHLQGRQVHEGYNFRFGHKATGDVALLSELGREMNFEVITYSAMESGGEPVSSSHIRKLLVAGQPGRARKLLGRPFSILSTPAHGRGYGSKYTVPTVNLAPYAELVPSDGVYVTRTRVGDLCFDSVTNIGNRPTFGADSFAIESHLLGFQSMDLNEQTEVEIYFLYRLRGEIKFPSVDDLKQQIGRDIAKTQRYFRLLKMTSKSRPRSVR